MGDASVRPAVRPAEGNSPTIKPYREYVPFWDLLRNLEASLLGILSHHNPHPKVFPFLPKLHFQFPFLLSPFPFSFPSISFPFKFLFLSLFFCLRPFICARNAFFACVSSHRVLNPHTVVCVKAAFTHIQISGYLDIRISEIFGAFTRVGSKRFRRLHVSRHPDALYAAYSLCGRNTQLLFYGQVACLQTLFYFFLSFLFIFVGLTTRSKFCLISSVIDHKTQR